MINETLKNYSKEQLIELIEGYCKNWLAMDGVWFQSVERKYGMDEAMELVQMIVQTVYEETGDVLVEKYLKNR